jgi:hypothetical protein
MTTLLLIPHSFYFSKLTLLYKSLDNSATYNKYAFYEKSTDLIDKVLI